jgi:hypothetical protein
MRTELLRFNEAVEPYPVIDAWRHCLTGQFPIPQILRDR